MSNEDRSARSLFITDDDIDELVSRLREVTLSPGDGEAQWQSAFREVLGARRFQENESRAFILRLFEPVITYLGLPLSKGGKVRGATINLNGSTTLIHPLLPEHLERRQLPLLPLRRLLLFD